MKPYYQDSAVTIYHADCREVLPNLETVDAVVTDPPYGLLNQFGVQDRPDGLRTLQFDWDDPETTNRVLAGLDLAFQRCSSRGAAFVFCGSDQFGRVLETVRFHGFTAKPAAWVKDCPPPAAPGNWWPSGFELAIFGYRPGAWFGDTDPKRSNVFRADTYRHGQPGKVNHPTQKPLGLMRHVVSSVVPPNGLLVDAFMGSGTTLRAAKDVGRKAIGIEVEERYCELAAKRCGQEVLAFTA